MSKMRQGLANEARECAVRQLQWEDDADNYFKVLKLIEAVAGFDGYITVETADMLEAMLALNTEVAADSPVTQQEDADQ